MCEMWLYPVRGIRAAAPVEFLDVSKSGIRFDREIVLISCDEKKPLNNFYHKQMRYLR